MKIKSLLIAAAFAVATGAPAQAVPVNVVFDLGPVKATFYGLDNEIGDKQNPTSVDLVTDEATYSDIFANSLQNMEFEFERGQLNFANGSFEGDNVQFQGDVIAFLNGNKSSFNYLDLFSFHYYFARNPDGGQFERFFGAGFRDFCVNGPQCQFLSPLLQEREGGIATRNSGIFHTSNLPYNYRNSITVVNPVKVELLAPVPAPAGGLLLLTGFAGFAGVRRWTKRAA